jgi:hypothetical protein
MHISNASCWDKNYTDDSLEVKDGHGRVVLQVKLLPNIVQIQEEWQWNPGTPSGGLFLQGKYDDKTGINQSAGIRAKYTGASWCQAPTNSFHFVPRRLAALPSPEILHFPARVSIPEFQP